MKPPNLSENEKNVKELPQLVDLVVVCIEFSIKPISWQHQINLAARNLHSPAHLLRNYRASPFMFNCIYTCQFTGG